MDRRCYSHFALRTVLSTSYIRHPVSPSTLPLAACCLKQHNRKPERGYPMSTTIELPKTTANKILNALPLQEYERLSADLEPVSLPLGEVLCHPDEPITHVYFPNHGTVSLVSNFEDGSSVE